MTCFSCQFKKTSKVLKDITIGYTKLILNSKEDKELVKTRLSICATCPNIEPLIKINYKQYYKCSLCSCPLNALANVTESLCEAKKW